MNSDCVTDIGDSANKYFMEDCRITMRERIPDNSIDLILCSPPYDCYSDDTETLTDNGWKLIKDVGIGEHVMTLDPETQKIFYQPAINTFNYKFDGTVINFKNKDNIDLVVTKNHKMLLTNKNNKPFLKRYDYLRKKNENLSYLREAKDVKCGFIPYTNYKWKGNDVKYFILPRVDCLYNKQNKVFEEVKIPMIYWCRFLGIYLAEGSARGTKTKKRNRYSIEIKQKDEPYVSMIRDILDNLPFKYKETIEKSSKSRINAITKFSITDRQLWDYLYILGNSHEKYIPKEIKGLSPQYLKELLLYMFIGDGTKRKSFESKSFTIDDFQNYKSVSKRLRDDLQECLIKYGKFSSTSKNGYVSNKPYKHINYNNVRKEKIQYNGNVVCLEVEKHNIILVRRNGKVVFSGNSIRSYKDNIKKDKHNVYSFPFEEIAQLLTKKLVDGGVIVWVVGDSVADGSETATSLREALYFMDECGLKLHDTMIYEKNGTSFPARRDGKRYSQIFEYMFVFTKGKIKTGNLICDKKNKWEGWTNWGKKSIRSGGDDLKKTTDNKPIPKYSPRNNIWKYITGAGYSAKDKVAHEHPAIFPDLLAHDHILTWTDECDVVYDPFAGSGTVLKMAQYLDRFYIGSEMTMEYEHIIKERLESDKFALKAVEVEDGKLIKKNVTKPI